MAEVDTAAVRVDPCCFNTGERTGLIQWVERSLGVRTAVGAVDGTRTDVG